ncbi:MAG TPA: hypothetical protein VIJ94_02545 [Caulobacteraceae bacterium]
MAHASKDRPKTLETENEDLKPVGEGKPPRQASEPKGSEGSEVGPGARTDPSSGEHSASDGKRPPG